MPHDRLDALLDLLALDGMPRSGWVLAGVQRPESIAAHGLGAVLVALAVGPSVEPPVDVDRVASLCAVHDAPEAWLGDIPRRGAEHLPAGAKHAAEDGVADRLLGALSPLARERFAEFQAGDTREARLARLCDKLHLGLRLLGYVRAGVRGLDGFRPGLEELDCSEFPPCDELRGDILARLDTLSGPP